MPDWSPSILVPLYALQWIALLFLAALVLGAYNQIGQVQRTLSRRPSRLRPGDHLPADDRIPASPRMFLAVLSHGCGPCATLARNLEDAELGDWDLITVITGEPVQPGTPATPELHLPSAAQPVYDPERSLARELGIAGTPVVLAFVDGKLKDQKIAPSVEWFETIARRQTVGKKEAV